MRTNKLLVAALATLVSSSVFAQSIFFYGDYTATPGSGTQVIPLSLRFTPDPNLPNLPSIGGGSWKVRFDTRYVDLRVTNAAGVTRLASQAPAAGTSKPGPCSYKLVPDCQERSLLESNA